MVVVIVVAIVAVVVVVVVVVVSAVVAVVIVIAAVVITCCSRGRHCCTGRAWCGCGSCDGFHGCVAVALSWLWSLSQVLSPSWLSSLLRLWWVS